MKEHFNEKYVESEKFPKATFDGKLTNVGAVNFSKDGTYNVTAAGKLTIHGVTQEVSVPGTVEVKGSTVRLKTKFVIELKDYKVQVPSMVADKVSKEATIVLDSELAKK
jgi:polyisoprenoid-binding protein YceI